MIALFTLLGARPVAPHAVRFDVLTAADARQRPGATVSVEFVVGRPAETADGQERTAVLRGDRLADLKGGATVSAVGTVRVIRPAEGRVGNVVPAWDEVRFEER